KELFGRHKIGEEVEARVTGVRRDGRLNLTIRSKAYRQMGDDAEEVYLKIQDLGGRLPFTDKASPMVIDREFGLSKAAFKRAIGKLLKEERIRITEDGIEVLR
ncbi:MAG: RNA-binding protein, partial [Lachnospiraceae bacterium]|nr:RNA-binding protein [Lachnospiraceae bacterium]